VPASPQHGRSAAVRSSSACPSCRAAWSRSASR
jgi:hypothetical protein